MELNFSIDEPVIVRSVDAASFGVIPENPDNTEALQRAVDYMAENPGTRLAFAKAVYRFASEKQIEIRNVTDGMLDGGDSVFLWSEKGYFSVVNVCRFSAENLIIDWDWENRYRLADMIRVVRADEESVEFEHFEVDEVQRNVWKSVNQYDPEDLTPGVEFGKEYEINYFQPCVRSMEYPGGNHSIVHHDGLLQDMQPAASSTQSIRRQCERTLNPSSKIGCSGSSGKRSEATRIFWSYYYQREMPPSQK